MDREFLKLVGDGRFLPSIGTIAEQRTEDTSKWPLVSVCVYIEDVTTERAADFLHSLSLQTSENWQLCVVGKKRSDEKLIRRFLTEWGYKESRLHFRVAKSEQMVELWNQAAKLATMPYLMFCTVDSVLAPQAIYEYSRTLNERPAVLAYCDDVELPLSRVLKEEDTENLSPEQLVSKTHFKPDFAPEYLESFDYINGTFVIDRECFFKLDGFDAKLGYAASYALELEASRSGMVQHISQVLVFLFPDPSGGSDSGAVQAALRRHIKCLGANATVRYERSKGLYRPALRAVKMPKVSIIIPNMDHLEDLKKVLHGIFEETHYDDIEVVIVENNSTQPETFTYYEKLEKTYSNCKVVTCNGTFNYARTNNVGRRVATGDYLLFLNNDVEIIANSWLSEMVFQAMRQGVGVVGAMLYYPDDTIQHAGVIVDAAADCRHVGLGEKRGTHGYMMRYTTAQDYSAVTGACFLTSAAIFDELDGFDESFAMTYNDIDYCFRVRQSGKRVVWTPYAELYHAESKTRGHDDETAEREQRTVEERSRFLSKYMPELRHGDPYYSPYLSYDNARFIENSKEGWGYKRCSPLDVFASEEDEPLRHRTKREELVRGMYVLAQPFRALVPDKMKQKIRAMLFGYDYGPATEAGFLAPEPYQKGMYPNGINLYGLLTTHVGLGQAARLYGKAILDADIPCAFRDIPLGEIDDISHDEGSFVSMLSEESPYNVSIIHINPDNLAATIEEFPKDEFDNHYVIGVWLWELEELPIEWREAFCLFDEIWTPSRFVQNAVKKDSPVPVTCIPYGIEAPVESGCSRATFGLPDDGFLVLFMYDAHSSSDRKNPQAAVDAFFKAFNGVDDARLVLKTRTLANSSEKEQLLESVPNPDKIIFLSEDLPKERLNALISVCDVFLSLHHSEGFGLVMAEAMYLGVPVVGTGWSANMEFMDEDTSCVVDYDLVDIDHYYKYDINASWADPHVDEAASYLRLLHDDTELYDRYVSAGRTRIQECFSIARSGELIKERFERICSLPEPEKDSEDPSGVLLPPAPFELGAYPMGVNLFGFLQATNGLAQGARLYAAALEAVGIPHELLDADVLPYLNLTKEDNTYANQLAKRPKYEVNVFCVNSPEYANVYRSLPQEFFDNRYNIGVWLWELETLPNTWFPGFKYLDEIWVPSTFIYDTVKQVSELPTTVIPYGIKPELGDAAADRMRFGLPEDDFLVLVMYDANSYIGRKNPQAAVDAFFKAFGNDTPGVKLVVKVREPSERDLALIKDRIGDCSNVIFFVESLSREDTNAFISCCDVYISLHRSEGFGLILAEAMYLGVPVVATNWSANTDFMNDDVACMVNYRFVPTGEDYFGDIPDARWADPDVNQAAEYLKRLFEDQEFYSRISNAGQEFIRTKFSLEESGRQMQKRLNEIADEDLAT